MKWALALLLVVGRVARADSERLVLGTHDPALAAALSVAVSPRGLSVFERPEPLFLVADAEAARHDASVPGTVAVVWLCADEVATHALCFCDGAGRLAVRPLTVTSPLSAPEAAAVALSVKMLLGAPSGVRDLSPAPPAPAAAVRPATPSPAAPPAAPPVAALPAVAVEVMSGARLQAVAAQPTALRLELAAVYAPTALGRTLGVGLGLQAGPALALGAPAGRTINDRAVELFARARRSLGRPWLELDLGPALHVLSVAAGPSASSRADLAIVIRTGVVVPVGRAVVGVRAGGFARLTSAPSPSPSPSSSPSSPAPELTRWNGEVLATLGVAWW